jgi:hypothetical protein
MKSKIIVALWVVAVAAFILAVPATANPRGGSNPYGDMAGGHLEDRGIMGMGIR